MTEKTMKTIIQVRRDTAANWEKNKNVIPAAGEPCLDLDTGAVKWGDGVTAYENLPVQGGNSAVNEEFRSALERIDSKLGSIEDNAQENVIESIKMNGSDLPVASKTVDIPRAAIATPGIVMGSADANKVAVLDDGTMEVNSLNVNKLVQGDSDVLILSGGDSAGY